LISWINGDLVELWQINQKFFVLINCQGLGYEIQILESFFLKLKTNQTSNKNITLWIKHIKKDDSDLLFGFTSKDQKNIFNEILSIRGVGSQIGMGLLNKFSISEVINAIKTKDKKLICSVPGIGQKMSDRLILELKNKFKSEILFEEEKNIEDNPNSKKKRMEIKFSCGEDGISEYLDDGWNILKEDSQEKICTWKSVPATKDCNMEKDKGCKITKPDRIGKEKIYLLEK